MLNNLLGLIDEFIKALARASIYIPDDSNRNIYTRACWVLGQSQRLKLATKGEDFARFEQKIKQSLPTLKKLAERPAVWIKHERRPFGIAAFFIIQIPFTLSRERVNDWKK